PRPPARTRGSAGAMEGSRVPAAQPLASLAVEPRPQDATVVLVPVEPPPRDYLACSLASLLYFNCCFLGLMAVVFSIKSRDRRMLGDRSGARSYGSRARQLNIAAVLLTVVATAALVAILARQAAAIA
ncbi:DSA2B protein, partial [Eudromia elegans]|nr:DSA2B protein [Eudromia elegans]